MIHFPADELRFSQNQFAGNETVCKVSKFEVVKVICYEMLHKFRLHEDSVGFFISNF